MLNIGRLELVNIRDVWRTEDKDFTPWLAENIDFLNDVLGFNLQVEETEYKAGSFEIDILATDAQEGKVIIENQYSKSDHNHLGKVLTYLTSVDATAAIWICEEPRQEHVDVINELNKSLPQRFYMVELKAYKIQDSPPAPMFNLVAGPVVSEIEEFRKEHSTREVKRRHFWTQMLKKMTDKTDLFSGRAPPTSGWFGAGAGKEGVSYQMGIQKHAARINVWLYIDSKEVNKTRFDELLKHREKIESEFGGKLDWRRMDEHRSSSIEAQVSTQIGWDDEGEELEKLQEDMIETLLRLEKTFKPYIQQL